MKICWDNLEGIHLDSKGMFRKKTYCLIYKESCRICGEPFLTYKYDNAEICSLKCVNINHIGSTHSEESKLKISEFNKGKKFSQQHKDNISKSKEGIPLSKEHRSKISLSNKGKHSGSKSPSWKGGVKKLKLPLYKTYSQRLDYAEETRIYIDEENRELLEIKCSKCDKWFVPNLYSVIDRIRSLVGKKPGEQKFYCSQRCKDTCEIYGKCAYNYITLYKKEDIFTQEELSIWSQEVLSRANNTCEICGTKAEHAHHIQPKKLEPGLALDPDNGLALCKECHNKHGHNNECSTGRLSKTICNKGD